MEIEKELNAMILSKTLQIKEQHPELAKLLDEMPVTIPDEKNPEINLNILREYYDSLTRILEEYS